MLTIDQLDSLQDTYLRNPSMQDNVEAAFFLKQDVASLLDAIKNDNDVLYVKVFLVQESVNGVNRLSLAMCGGKNNFAKAGAGIIAEVPCPPLCGHELLHPKIVLPKPPTPTP